MRYLSVCSGIEAAAVAWHPLGWQAVGFSDIEDFPRQVLRHHYPAVPLHGDFTRLIDDPPDCDVLVGGTPCQAFSIAGLRNSLEDDRGNLTLQFVKLAEAIDAVRRRRSAPPVIVVWENVPGIFSTEDNAFGCYLGALVGEVSALVPPGGRWTHAGLVAGPIRTAAWRVLDAQYFGLAQRRERIFVVASARTDVDPAAVLFEPGGRRRHSPPRRGARTDVTGPLVSRATSGGGLGTDLDCTGGQQPVGSDDVALTLLAHKGPKGQLDPTCETMIAEVTAEVDEVAAALRNRSQTRGVDIDCTNTLIPEAFSFKPSHYTRDKDGAPSELSPPLTADADKGDQDALVAEPFTRADQDGTGAIAFHPTQDPISSEEVCHALGCGSSTHGQATAAVATAMAVRRLTPRECERLQGFPDDYTRIPVDRRAKPPTRRQMALYPDCFEQNEDGTWTVYATDGARYRALGNSMAVPVMAWVGRRIDAIANRKEPARE